MNIYKVGGDVTEDAGKIQLFKELIGKDPAGKVLVVSAARGVTDMLINSKTKNSEEKDKIASELLTKHLELASQLGVDGGKVEEKLRLELDGVNDDNPDNVVSIGERLMALLLTEYLNSNGSKVGFTTGHDAGILVNGDKVVVRNCKDKVKSFFQENFFNKSLIPVVTGFDGVSDDAEGRRVTLGRSGSDQTATFLAYALNAESVHLLKNTKGVMTADPLIVGNSKNIQHISYDMAMEAGNIQLEALQFVKKDSIPLFIQDINDSNLRTKVDYHCSVSGIKLVTGIEDCVFFEVGEIRDRPGAEKEIIDSFFKYKINKEISLDTRNSVAFVLNSGLDKISLVVKELKDHSIKIQNCSLITIIGNIDKKTKQLFENYVWELCEPLSSASWIKGSIVANVVVPREKFKQVIKYLHKKFIEEKEE